MMKSETNICHNQLEQHLRIPLEKNGTMEMFPICTSCRQLCHVDLRQFLLVHLAAVMQDVCEMSHEPPASGAQERAARHCSVSFAFPHEA